MANLKSGKREGKRTLGKCQKKYLRLQIGLKYPMTHRSPISLLHDSAIDWSRPLPGAVGTTQWAFRLLVFFIPREA